jgi:hypothetical protein
MSYGLIYFPRRQGGGGGGVSDVTTSCHLYPCPFHSNTKGTRKRFGLTSSVAILSSLRWIPNIWWLHIFPSCVTHRCHPLGSFRMASQNHSLRVLWCHARTAACLQFPCHCWSSAPSWTLCCVQVLSVHKLHITDDGYLTVYRLLSAGTTRSASARDNRLPLCDSCPWASTAGLGNDAAVFSRHARLGQFGRVNDALRLHYPMTILAISQLVICRNSSPCPNHLRTPFVRLITASG